MNASCSLLLPVIAMLVLSVVTLRLSFLIAGEDAVQ
jgi:hypothetical protein